MLNRLVEHYAPLLDDPEAFRLIVSEPPSRSFRVNTLKSTVGDVIARLADVGISTTPVSWYDAALVSDSDRIGNTLDRFVGAVYFQELASMLPPLIAGAEIERAAMILDACAAPGSKSTQIAAVMSNRGCIVANDRSYTRIKALKYNLNKAGVVNTVITNFELHDFPAMTFDVIFLDAPCSSDGTVRKNPNLLEIWSPERSRQYAERQRGLILRAFELLQPGGTLVYSTCSLAPEENEAVVDHLLSRCDARLAPIVLDGFRFSPAVPEWQGRVFSEQVQHAVRVWPHHNNTDGFFIVKVIK